MSGISATSPRFEGETGQLDDPGKITILLVDDEPNILKALCRLFFNAEYRVLAAANATEALAIMAREAVQLIISDNIMPGMTGTELLRKIREQWPQTIRIMLTGFADTQSVMQAVNEGAVYKFITKPWDDNDLLLSVRLALQQYRLAQENRKLKELAAQQQAKLNRHAAFTENRGLAGRYLVRAGLITEADLTRAEREKQPEQHIGDVLVALGKVSEEDIAATLQKFMNLPRVELATASLNPALARLLPEDLCRQGRVIPFEITDRHLKLAMADPSDIHLCDVIAMLTSLRVDPVIARASDILAALGKQASLEKKPPPQQEALEVLTDLSHRQANEPVSFKDIDIVFEKEEEADNFQNLAESTEQPSVVKIVNGIISQAIASHASDIHIEPKPGFTLVRFRIDGMLHSRFKIRSELHPATVSRIKILAKMNISERRVPQDGRITVKSEARLIDVRVATMPTINGEKVVMRILDRHSSIIKLDELGMLPRDLKQIETLMKRPHGIIITTGPTGSGKTTTLYSILHTMLENTKNYQTIEDPVEYYLAEASQIHVLEKTGLTFPSVLRSTMRQDPDVILVGEIRDLETADIAFKAAITGHMVLSSLHTSTAIGSITRLINMDLPPYLIASALEGIISQRLVRRICPHCSGETAPPPELLALLKIQPASIPSLVRQGSGCSRCHRSGYAGRTGIYEILVMNDEFRQLVSNDYQEKQLQKMALEGGMVSLLENGMEKVRMGQTTLAELLRVLGAQIRYERQCSACARVMDATFRFCPYCGGSRRNYCEKCQGVLENDWLVCPFCGQTKAIETPPLAGTA